VRETRLVVLEKHLSDFEGSQAVPARPSVLPIARHGPHRKHGSSILYALVAVLTCLFAKPLLSNNCSTFAYFKAVV
jgi:hypothetical protein